MCTLSKARTEQEILAYLVEHPQAQDTLEGIVEWWLLEQRIVYQTGVITEALAELVDKRLLVERKGRDARSHYRLNRRKLKEIVSMLQEVGIKS